MLNLGSQYGDNADTDDLGLVGTIPAQLGNLRQLRELSLQSNSLTGTLPDNLCNGGESAVLLGCALLPVLPTRATGGTLHDTHSASGLCRIVRVCAHAPGVCVSLCARLWCVRVGFNLTSVTCEILSNFLATPFTGCQY